MTKIIRIDPKRPDMNLIKECAEAINTGKTVVFPTETVYGLGSNALDAQAVKKIFEAKGRPTDNPLIVHIAYPVQVDELAKDISPKAKKLMDRFWPGPLTLLLWKKSAVPDVVTAGLPKVGIRMPSNPIAHALLKEADTPIAAPSANLSGKISPTHADDVIDDLYDRVDIIIDGGDSKEGIESTVIDMTAEVPLLLRPGTVTQEQIEKVIGPIQLHPSLFSVYYVDAPASPGMKYRHYSPRKELVLVSSKKLPLFLKQNSKKRIAVVTTVTDKKCHSALHVHLGKNKKVIAKKIFRTLRKLDKEDIDFIVVESIDEKDIGLGIMNRLKKGASRIVD